MAYNLNAGFVPVRKPGKLPWETVEQAYELEYGTDSIEMHQDAIHPGERVLIVDDLIATGGTAHLLRSSSSSPWVVSSAVWASLSSSRS